MAGAGLASQGIQLSSLKSLDQVKYFVNSRGFRVTVTGSLLVLLLVTMGVSKQLADLSAFRGALSPANQAAYDGLPFLEQIDLYSAARAMKLPPGAVDYYLEHANAADMRLTNIPLAEALRVSALAEQSGNSALILEYVTRYGSDPLAMRTLLESSPEAIGAIRYIYDARTGQYVDLSTRRFVSPRDLPWPEGNNGFASAPIDTTLPVDYIVDRYGRITANGRITGRYAGEPGTSIWERGMAIGSEDMQYIRLRVIRPLTVPAGPAAEVPAFGASGGGTQYYFEKTIQWYIDNGYLEVVP
jgi:hypothetical protein